MFRAESSAPMERFIKLRLTHLAWLAGLEVGSSETQMIQTGNRVRVQEEALTR